MLAGKTFREARVMYYSFREILKLNMQKRRASRSKVLSEIKSSRPMPILGDYMEHIFKKQTSIEEINNSDPRELPAYMRNIYMQHIIMENRLGNLYSVLRNGMNLAVIFNPIDDRLPLYRRQDYINLLEEWDIKKTFLFMLHGYCAKLCNIDRPERSLELTCKIFEEASMNEIIFQYRNIDSNFGYNIDFSIFLMEFDSENPFYVFLHKSKYGSKGTRVNIIISDWFISFYESIYFYTKNSLAHHIDFTKQLNRGFFFKKYNLYKDRKMEHSLKMSKIVYFKED